MPTKTIFWISGNCVAGIFGYAVGEAFTWQIGGAVWYALTLLVDIRFEVTA